LKEENKNVIWQKWVSKDKRSNTKIVILALVVNVEVFIKYSAVFDGNMSDSNTIPEIIKD